jgi:hypothetical protein
MKEPTIRIASKFDEEYEPLIIRGSDEDELEQKAGSVLFKVGSAVFIILSVIVITIGAAMYKIEEEKRFVAHAHASLVAEQNNEVCVLEKSSLNTASCPHKTTTFLTPATFDGNWPSGFSVYFFTKDDQSLLHSENGMYMKSSTTSGSKCKAFMTELCLDGDYLVYTTSKLNAPETGYVYACEKYRVESGEALSFHVTSSASKAECSDESFENAVVKLPLRAKLPNPDITESDTTIAFKSLDTTDVAKIGNHCL